jgi:hypothetical protein
MEAALILGVIFAFVIMIIWLDARKKERMFLLKQDKDPNLANSKDDIFFFFIYLKWGIIIIGVGLGTLLGSIFRNNSSTFIAYLLICSGAGIVVSFLVTRSMLSGQSKGEQSVNDEPMNDVKG